ncbi:MAG: glycosyltransferase family 4 protein [Planctomycetes bacterium]|nr:glycosyltransferase family 4 protein [Planctomycetota bacterium]
MSEEPSPLSVLVVTSQLPPDIGGTSVHAAEIARGMAAAGHQVTVVIRDRDPDEFRTLELDVRSVNTKRGWIKPIRLRRAQNDLLALVEELSIQVVFFSYTVVGFGDVYARLRGAGVPFAVGLHGINQHDLDSEQALKRRRRKWGLEHADRAIACTQWLADKVAPLVEPALGRPADVVYLGIDPEIDRLATPEAVAKIRTDHGLEGKLVLLALGRFAPRKNFDQIIRLLPRLSERFADLVLLLVGGGKEEQAWRALADELGVTDRVIWAGRCGPLEVGAYYKAADLFVTVSKTRPDDDSYETFGLVYAEANLCGTAVIGGRDGGVPDAIEEGETGLLVDADDEQGIYHAIATLLADGELRNRMGTRGRERVLSLFTWERAARETADILRAIARP